MLDLPCMESQNLLIRYDNTTIIEDLSLSIPKGKITVFVGANGCGKSTLLRSFCRLLKPQGGDIFLLENNIRSLSSKYIAQQLAILPQGPIAPEGLTVKQLVKQGRYPHQNWLQQWSKDDERLVNHALSATGLLELSDRTLESLSGGQRQRAWIAMSLAQDADILFLDEPTTYLDMSHQIEILDLLYDMNQESSKTIVMVLHDLNLACRYAHYIVAIKDKSVFAQGQPQQVVSKQMVKAVFNMNCEIVADPIFATPMCIPHGKGQRVTQS